MEEIAQLVTGVFKEIQETVFPDGEDSEEEGDTDIQWVGYSDVKDLAGSLQLVPPCKPKRVKGEMIDLQTQNRTLVAGTFHLKDPWWQTVILRTKKNKDKSLEAKDWNALCYKLRDDPHRLAERHADMLLTKIASSYEGKHATEASWLTPLKNEFYEYLSVRGLQDQLSLDNLETHVTEFAEHLNTQGGGGGGQKGGGGGEGEPKGGNSTPQDGHQGDLFKDAILLSEEYNQISVARAFPQLMRYLPQVLPGYFLKILTVSRQHLEQLHTLIDEQPGFLAFKDLLKKHCGLLGMETSSEALTRCGLLGRVSEDVCGAVYMYEYLKRETKENGHTGVLYDRVMDTLSPTVSTLEQSLDFLNGHKITKTIVEGGHRLVYLTSLWQAENKIAKGVAKLIKNHGEQPWDLEVDLDSEGFDGIRGDPDQLQAARLISTQPVVAISGKGGCGKTYVVTKVITTAKAQREERWTQEKGDHMADWLRDKQDRRDHLESMLEQTGSEQERTQTLRQIEALDSEREPPCPDLVELLLTAPTGKAANLLGKRAGLPSYTLHQVIYSFRNNPPHQDWKHKDVNVLVVDECSLVAVSTFAFLIELLMKHAKLRRLVLLGDVRQLPSIEPGNFLLDTFSSLNRIGCSVELRTNHRAESQLIVDNATLISKKQQPSFHREKFMFRRLPEGNPTKSGDDYLSQDIIMEVQQMLSHSDLQDHSTSQFISFTRMVCEAINDVCCSKYSGHRIRDDKKKYMFQRGDKICCTKNGYVNKYEDTRQGMTSRSQDKASVDGVVPDGGVERAVRSGEGSDISLIEGSTMGTQAGSHGMQGSQGKGASKDEKIRLCNGEIFYILDEKTEVDPRGKASTYFQLSDKDKDQEFVFWADRLQLRKQCKIRHAWARTIHTFQGSETDHVVYIVGSRTWRQNWQHVYTAVTRGRKSVFIVGQDLTLRNAIKRPEIKRQTSLKKQLVEKFQKNKDILVQMAASPGRLTQSQSTSCDQQCQPMKMCLMDDSSILNNTQLITDVLTSLACAHDEFPDIEEYDSDETGQQKGFTAIKAPTLPQPYGSGAGQDTRGAKQGTVLRWVTRNLNLEKEDAGTGIIGFKSKGDVAGVHLDSENTTDGSDVKNDPDLSDLQSILSTPAAQVKLKSKVLTQAKHGQISSDVNIVDRGIVSTYQSTAEIHDKKAEDSADDSGDSDSLISPLGQKNATITRGCLLSQRINTKLRSGDLKTTQRKSCNISDNTAINDTNPLNENTRNNQHKSNPQTSGDTSKNSKSEMIRVEMQDFRKFTPLTTHHHLSNTNTKKTSSPFPDNDQSGFHFHIHTGLSPLSPNYNDSFCGLHDSSASHIQSPLDVLDRDEGQGPQSSDSMLSQWSEIDEHEYLRITDESITNHGPISEWTTPASACVKKSSNFLLTNLKSEKRNSNVSNTSQWSEMDDDNYIALDLADIERMKNKASNCTAADSIDTANYENNRAYSSPQYRSTVSSVGSTPSTSSSTGADNSSGGISRSAGSSPQKRKSSQEHGGLGGGQITPVKRLIKSLSVKDE